MSLERVQVVCSNALLKYVSLSRNRTTSEGTSSGCLAAIILLIKCLQEHYKFCLGMLQIAYKIALLKTVFLSRNKTSVEGTCPDFLAANNF